MMRVVLLTLLMVRSPRAFGHLTYATPQPWAARCKSLVNINDLPHRYQVYSENALLQNDILQPHVGLTPPNVVRPERRERVS